MTGFCKNHIGARTPEELKARYAELERRGELTPGLLAEKTRISNRLAELGTAPEFRPSPPSLLDLLDAPIDCNTTSARKERS